MAMVLVALLGGGDYAPEGLAGFGESILASARTAACSDHIQVPLSHQVLLMQDCPTS